MTIAQLKNKLSTLASKVPADTPVLIYEQRNDFIYKIKDIKIIPDTAPYPKTVEIHIDQGDLR